MNKLKIKILTVTIIVVANLISFYFLELNKNKSINLVKSSVLSNFQIRLDILLYNQERYANMFYRDILATKNFIELFTKFKIANKDEQDIIRTQLINVLKPEFNIFKSEGINIFQFVDSKNISILRMHKPEKFGDDLTKTRSDFVSVNKSQEILRVFSQGKNNHGFRNIYPIFSKTGNYLGAMEISFSGNSVQDYFTLTSQTHTHLIIKKNNMNSINNRYLESKEHKSFFIDNYMINDKTEHIIHSKKLFHNIKDEISGHFNIGNSFAIYNNIDKQKNMIIFLPISNITQTENIAWIIIYQKNNSIYRILKSHFIVQTVLILLYIFLGYIIYHKLVSQIQMKEEHYLLHDILNSTNAIMFVTNFKKLAFSNKGFQDFFNIQNNAEYRDNLLDIFTKNTGFLSSSMLKENETFYDLIERTSSENRTVSVLDKTFHINATKTSYNKNRDGSDYCLVTLTDITNRIRIQEEMEQKAYTDSLTGVPNRNKFNDVVEKQFSIDARYKENLTISILDIDHFKKFNDTFGHLIGDEVLIMLAKYVTDSIRTADTFARWGGEEFVLLFPKTDKERAKNVCDKLRIGISNLEHKVAGNITASFGVAQYQDGDTLETMFKRCDDALYKAKENGRNQVVVI